MSVARFARRVGAEDGMTLIEVMVAGVILVIGVLALLTTLTSSQALGSKSDRESQALDYAQMQMEQLRSLPYASLALSSCTTGGATWTGFATASDTSYIAPLATEPEVTPCTGKVAPTATWQDDRQAVRGTVYRYVTQAAANVKRIVVAVTVTSGAGRFTRPVTISTLVPDPDAGQSNGTLITGGGNPCPLADLGLGLVCLS